MIFSIAIAYTVGALATLRAFNTKQLAWTIGTTSTQKILTISLWPMVILVCLFQGPWRH